MQLTVGTCIFWHHRGMHGPGVNHSDRMRLAVLHEWVRKDVNDGPPPHDMWRDWSEAVRNCPDHSGQGAHHVGAAPAAVGESLQRAHFKQHTATEQQLAAVADNSCPLGAG